MPSPLRNLRFPIYCPWVSERLTTTGKQTLASE